MQIPKFHSDELKVVAEAPDFFGDPRIPIYNFPVTRKEAVRSLYEKKVVWPDIDSWDWEGASKANEQYLSSPASYSAMFMNGFFERLISF
jgi:hypothetical protein